MRDFVKNIYKRVFNLNDLRPDSSASRLDVYGSELSISRPSDRVFADKFGYSSEYCYFLLSASYGDKWLILSLLHELFRYQNSAKIIADVEDMELSRIFFGNDVLKTRFIFEDSKKISELSARITPISCGSTQLTYDDRLLPQLDLVCKYGMPLNEIRHLHIVKYPYFSDLHISYGITYGALLKMILYIPLNSLPQQPKFYSSLDYTTVSLILSREGLESNIFFRTVLFNAINFSHHPLSLSQISICLDEFEKKNIFVYLNVAQAEDLTEFNTLISARKNTKLIQSPGHLLALISLSVDGILGVMGGAMCVAGHFSHSAVLSLYTTAHGFDGNSRSVHGGKFKDNIWNMTLEDWPRNSLAAIVENIDIGDPAMLEDDKLRKIIDDFCDKFQ